MFAFIYWDPPRAFFYIPYIHWPIVWYGLLFAAGFILAYLLFRLQLRHYVKENYKTENWKKLSEMIGDKLLFYVTVGTLIGARIGHLLFYEKPESYLMNPLEILKIWEGGLASHGAAIAIIFAIFLFSFKKFNEIKLPFLTLLDLVSAPIAAAGGFIRIGNFFNQEIIGTQTTLPWAVIFGHPFDGTLPAPRHPVQLYEAAFYFLTAYFLYRFTKRALSEMRGKAIGLFLISIFTFRFLVEFLKEEQSFLLQGNALTMGQYLSIPFILLGFFLILRKKLFVNNLND